MSISKKTRQTIFSKYDGKCAYCGNIIQFNDFTLDHIIPVNEFKNDRLKHKEVGFLRDHLQNLNPSCQSCNIYKKDLTIEKYREYIQTQIERLRIRVPGFKMAERFGIVKCFNKAIKFHFEKIINV